MQKTRLGALSVQILGEFFVTVTRKIPQPLTPVEAERRVINYVRSWLVYDITDATVMDAVRGVCQHKWSYWDSLIWATARVHTVPTVLSEDFSDGALVEGVRFLNPFVAAFELSLLERSS